MGKNYRLNPKRSSSRYNHLKQLRDSTLEFLDEINAGHNDKILLDFGCGDMPYKQIIEPRVGKYIGVDLEMNPLADHHIDFDSKTSLPDGIADIILSNQVLEHVDSPEGYLKEAWRLLKPGGSILLSTHGYWFYHPTPNDYWRWTSAGLRKVIERENFEIVRWKGIMGLTASGVQLFQDGVIFKLPKFLRSSFAFFMQLWVSLGDRMHSQAQRDRDASLYILIGRKSGLPESGLPKHELSNDRLPKDGLRKNDLPKDGLPKDGLPKDGLPKDGLPKDGLPKDGLPEDGLSKKLSDENAAIETPGNESFRPGE